LLSTRVRVSGSLEGGRGQPVGFMGEHEGRAPELRRARPGLKITQYAEGRGARRVSSRLIAVDLADDFSRRAHARASSLLETRGAPALTRH
jgi:hypothetical protein